MQSRRKEGLVKVLFFANVLILQYSSIFGETPPSPNIEGYFAHWFWLFEKARSGQFRVARNWFLASRAAVFFSSSHVCMLAMLEVRRGASHGCGGQLARKKLALKRRTMLSALTSALNPFISFWASVSPHLGSSGAGLCLPLILIHLALHCTILPRWKRHQMDR